MVLTCFFVYYHLVMCHSTVPLAPGTSALLYANNDPVLWLSLLITCAGDIELNPGPKKPPKYPCQICAKAVKWGQRGLLCDGCDAWSHADCYGMDTALYAALERDIDGSWQCCNCGMPNFNSSLFSSHQESTLPLNTSADSTPQSPLAHSSPDPQSSSKQTAAGQTQNRHGGLPIRSIVINCRSIKGKKAELDDLIDSLQPHIIFASETHLDSDYFSTEFFPTNFSVYRKDRNRHGGGVLLAVSNELNTYQLSSISTTTESVWVMMHGKGQPPICLGAVYRPPNATDDFMSHLCDTVAEIKSTHNPSGFIIAGDFNLPGIEWTTEAVTSGARNRKSCEFLLGMIDELALQQMVDQPTRGENTLDLFMTSSPGLVNQVLIGPGISDHDTVIINHTIKAAKTNSAPRTVYQYSKADWESANEELNDIIDGYMSTDPDSRSVTTNWTTIKCSLLSLMEKHIPHITVRGNKDLPYITKTIKREIRRRQRAYNKARRYNKPKDWARFRRIRKEVKDMLNTAYWEYLNGVINPDNDPSGKKFYRFIKSKKNDNFGVGTLRANGTIGSTNREKATILNNQFQSVFTKERTDEIPKMKSPRAATMPDVTITSKGVQKLLENLKPSKAAGPDQIPARLLKTFAAPLAPVLAQLFQQSLREGVVPDDWRVANVAPIFKKGDRSQAANYRPVSLTSIIGKLMEHVLASNIMTHFEDNTILTDLQHGFRSKRSCESQLLITTEDLLSAIDRGKQIDMAILDFSKAFDVVPHHRLMVKLEHLGIRGETRRWIKRWLENRKQRVVVNGDKSEYADVSSGVPQGSVLGPILFLAFINDICLDIKSCLRLFADDCLLYRIIESDSDRQLLQQDLDQLMNWADQWQMAFNVSKCHTMHITSPRKAPKEHPYVMRGTALTAVNESPYLGVMFNRNMKWTPHIDNIVAKGKRLLGFLRRNLRRCPQDLKAKAYTTLVRPVLEYSSSIWDPHDTTNINKLEKVQRLAARFVLNKPHKHTSENQESVTAMVTNLGWPSLEKRRVDSRLTLMYKMTHDLIKVPQSYHPKEKRGSTRSCTTLQLEPVRCNLDQYRWAFVPRTILDYNRLTPDARAATELSAFKGAISA